MSDSYGVSWTTDAGSVAISDGAYQLYYIGKATYNRRSGVYAYYRISCPSATPPLPVLPLVAGCYVSIYSVYLVSTDLWEIKVVATQDRSAYSGITYTPTVWCFARLNTSVSTGDYGLSVWGPNGLLSVDSGRSGLFPLRWGAILPASSGGFLNPSGTVSVPSGLVVPAVYYPCAGDAEWDQQANPGTTTGSFIDIYVEVASLESGIVVRRMQRVSHSTASPGLDPGASTVSHSAEAATVLVVDVGGFA